MKPDNKAFLKQTRKLLDDSADSLDAATLSRLNQARQKALQSQRSNTGFLPFKLSIGATAGIMASISIAVVGSWLLLSQPGMQSQQIQPAQLVYDGEDLNMLVSDTELELLEQLEFVSWLVEQDRQQNNAG